MCHVNEISIFTPIRRMEIEQVTLTSEVRDNGLFEFQPLQNELLNPFEGIGLESRWELKMPHFSNLLDFNDVSDIMISIEYTAMDSFQYRYQVLQELDNSLGFNRAFSLRNDYPDQWYELANIEEEQGVFFVKFKLDRQQFPEGLENIRLDGNNILLHFVRQHEFTDEIEVFNLSLSSSDIETEMNLVTNNGTIHANQLTNELESSVNLFVELQLAFENNFFNRELFSEEKVLDILLVLPCVGDLRSYPL